jgi:hypothetical protein
MNCGPPVNQAGPQESMETNMRFPVPHSITEILDNPSKKVNPEIWL